MNRRVVAVQVLVLLLLAIVFFSLTECSSNPSYNGRTLSQWINTLKIPRPSDLAEWVEALGNFEATAVALEVRRSIKSSSIRTTSAYHNLWRKAPRKIGKAMPMPYKRDVFLFYLFWKLTKLDDERKTAVLPHIRDALNDDDPRVRSAAIRCIAKLGVETETAKSTLVDNDSAHGHCPNNVV